MKVQYNYTNSIELDIPIPEGASAEEIQDIIEEQWLNHPAFAFYHENPVYTETDDWSWEEVE